MVSSRQPHQLHPSPHRMEKRQSISSITQLYYQINPNSPPSTTGTLRAIRTPSCTKLSFVSVVSPSHSLSSAYSSHSTSHIPPTKPISINNFRPDPPTYQTHPAALQPISSTPNENNPLLHPSCLPRFVQPQLKLKPRQSRSSSHLTRLSSAVSKPPRNIPPPLSSNYHQPTQPVYHSAIPVTISHQEPTSYHEKLSDPHFSILNGTDYQYPQFQDKQIHQIPQPLTYPHRPPTPSSVSDLSASRSSSFASPPFSLTPVINPTASTAPENSSFSSCPSLSSSTAPPSTHPIFVVVRVRDYTQTNSPPEKLVSFDNQTITLRIPQTVCNFNPQQVTSHEFSFDKIVYPIASSSQPNSNLYERCSIESKLVDPFLNGFNSCLIAYGQTGSGKSFTLGSDNNPANTDGLIPKTLERLFFKLNLQKRACNTQAQPSFHYELFVTFVEIYNNELIDLLANCIQTKSSASSKKVPIKINENKADGMIELLGCQKVRVIDSQEILQHFNQALNQRSIGFTHMNEASSRSHAIFTIHLVTSYSSPQPKNQAPQKVKKTFSKLQFVDLAGSERIRKTKNILGSDRFKEGISINAGLHALGNVISALSNQSTSQSDPTSKNKNQKKPYVPYRESKLTRLLKDSLGGNSQTVLLSCISQNPQDVNESLNTLRYSIRAKKIENNCSKITRVIQPPIIPPIKMKSSVHLKSNIPSINFKRALNSSPLTRRRSNHYHNHKSEIKKPMISMNELIRMKSRKSVIINTNQQPLMVNTNQQSLIVTPNQQSLIVTPNQQSLIATPNQQSLIATPNQPSKIVKPHQHSLINSDVHQQNKLIQSYLNQQVHKFIQRTQANSPERIQSIEALGKYRKAGAVGTSEMIRLLRNVILREVNQTPTASRTSFAIQSLIFDNYHCIQNSHALVKSTNIASANTRKDQHLLPDPFGHIPSPSVPVPCNPPEDVLFNFLVELESLFLIN